MLLADSISLFEEILQKITEVPGNKGKPNNNKLKTVQKKKKNTAVFHNY